jgi:hypothetical protein
MEQAARWPPAPPSPSTLAPPGHSFDHHRRASDRPISDRTSRAAAVAVAKECVPAAENSPRPFATFLNSRAIHRVAYGHGPCRGTSRSGVPCVDARRDVHCRNEWRR